MNTLLNFYNLFMLFLLAILLISASGRCLSDEQLVLLQLRDTLEFDPKLSTKLASWDQNNTDCCIWSGVYCNVAGQVIGLDLSHEKISGGFNDSSILFNLNNLQNLNMAFNHFKFNPIPTSNLNSAIFLSVSRNSFTGSIPQTICNASRLQVLDLSHNGLTSMIPKCLIEFGGNLQSLNLRNNSLNGSIVGTFTRNCSLTTLDLNDNSLHGKIPQSLANCKMLEVLNLGNNKINDTFPCFLRNNSNLQVLVLGANLFHGGLQCNIPSREKLKVLDIALNDFTGVVPADWFLNLHDMMITEKSNKKHLSCMVLQLNDFYYQEIMIINMKGIELKLVKILTIFSSIDISNNHFEGEIPRSIGQLKAIHYLNISHNHFTGSIPSSIGNLYQLESLGLSTNKLVGEIPSSFTGIAFLSVFNVSYNQLQGEIPKGIQFQTFEIESYIGNTGLCGFPLSKRCMRSIAPTSPASIDSHDRTWNLDDLISVGLGLVVGLIIFFSPLVFSKRWYGWYFKHVDRIFFKKLHQYYERRNRMMRAYRNPIRRL